MPDIHLDLLSQVRIASPCSVKWEDMAGDNRTRHCGQCDLNVHNIAAMTRDEANAFLAEKLGNGERVCGQLFKRTDGTILTRDCPVGLALVRQRTLRTAGRIAAAIGLASLAAWTVQAGENRYGNWAEWGWAVRLRSVPMVKWMRNRASNVNGVRMAGDIMMPQSPQPPKRSENDYGGPHMYDWN